MVEFTKDVLKVNSSKETERIARFISQTILLDMHKKGAVIGLSGGIDSAVVTALCVQSLGSDKVLGIILPEKDSNKVSEEYALILADSLGKYYERSLNIH